MIGTEKQSGLHSPMHFPKFLVAVVLAMLTGATCPRGEAQPSLTPLPTAQTALLGRFARGPVNVPVAVTAADFTNTFGSGALGNWPAEVQARQFFANGGASLYVVRVAGTGALADALLGDTVQGTGLYALRSLSNLRLLVAPELSLIDMGFSNALAQVRSFLEPQQIFLLMDPPPQLSNATAAVDWVESEVPVDASFCALYFPNLQINVDGVAMTAPASGAMAAIYSANDAAEGIWLSPAGTDYPLQATGLAVNLTTADSDLLNAHNINSIRQFPGTGIVPWGARVLDRYNTDNRYVAVVRTRLWAAASIQRSLAFAAIQDNAEPLWSQIRSTVGNFLFGLYQQGAFVGVTPTDSYFVKCDSTTTTASDIAEHRVNLVYGTALLRSAEFDVTSLSAATYDSALPTPPPSIDARILDSSLVMAYRTQPGFNYQLKTSSDLASGVTTDVGTTAAGDGSWQRLSVPMDNAQGFYSVRVSPGR
jgi:hypothetical protein